MLNVRIVNILIFIATCIEAPNDAANRKFSIWANFFYTNMDVKWTKVKTEWTMVDKLCIHRQYDCTEQGLCKMSDR